MSGPQFMHMETYSRKVSGLRKQREAARAEEGKIMDRKLTVEEICAEAARMPGASPHVEHASRPVLLYGVSPNEVPQLIEECVAQANSKIRETKAQMARGSRRSGPRSVRSDTHVLVTMVTSHPIPWVDEKTGEWNFDNPENRALLESWEAANIGWARLKAEALGFELVSVVRHEDEAHPHLHFFGIPKNERVEARKCHPGYVARDALEQGDDEDDKAFKQRRNRTYNEAMRAFQDDYYDGVSKDVGLVRIGPKRRRTPNAVYKAEKSAARAHGLANVHHEALKKEIVAKEADLAEASEMADKAGDEAAEAIIDASRFAFDRDQAEQELIARRAELDRLLNFQRELETVHEELLSEQAKLDEVRAVREEQEAKAAAVRAAAERDEQLLAREREDFAAERVKFNSDKKKHEQGIEKQRAEYEQKEAGVQILIEGIEAFADGRITIPPENTGAPFVLHARDEKEVALASRLKSVKAALEPILRRLDERLRERSQKMAGALQAAVVAWTRGQLEGVGPTRADGEPTFLVAKDKKGVRLLETINPFRRAVALVISVLPDRRAIHSITEAASKLGSRLTDAEQDEVRELQITMEAMRKQADRAR